MDSIYLLIIFLIGQIVNTNLTFVIWLITLLSSLWATSPIWASEASRARRRERAAKPRVASPLACLSRVYFSRYPPNGELARRLPIVQEAQLFEHRLALTQG